MKRCPCCTRVYSRDEWERLPHIGSTADLELRNCRCGSTLAVEIPRERRRGRLARRDGRGRTDDPR